MGPGFESLKVHQEFVLFTQRVHLFPFRTQKLSSAVPTIPDWRRSGKIGRGEHRLAYGQACLKLVLFTWRVHLFPFRTQKLSSTVPTIPDWRRSGKIGRGQHSSLAQSAEHAAVNRSVVGSSPTGGAKKEHHPFGWCFFLPPVDFQLMLPDNNLMLAD